MKSIMEQGTIAPHGGELVDRRVPAEERDERLGRAAELPRVSLGPRAISDLEMISTGVFSPLKGFLGREDYESVVETMHLASGPVWSMPITLSASDDEANNVSEGGQVALVDGNDRIVATMLVTDRYGYDKVHEANNVYRTDDGNHPGVAALYAQGDTLLGGEVTLLVDEPNTRPFPGYYYEPRELRALFAERGWKRVVGFQTRNPVHRAHEYIQKSALETVDGLLLNPLIGETKSDDIPADVRMKSYETILNRYYPRDKVMLAVSRRRCATRGRERRSCTPCAARTTAARTSSWAATTPDQARTRRAIPSTETTKPSTSSTNSTRRRSGSPPCSSNTPSSAWSARAWEPPRPAPTIRNTTCLSAARRCARCSLRANTHRPSSPAPK